MALVSNNRKRFYQKNEITQRRTSVYQVLSWAQSETADGEIDIAPDEILLVAKGKGFRSIHSDDLTEGVQSEHRKFRLYADGYLLNEAETNILGVDDVTISPVEIRSYDAQGISLESLCLAQRCQKFIFDNVGRLKQTQSSLGALQNFQYAGAESLPKTMTDERGVFSFSFSLISGEPLSMQTPKTVQYSWDYSKIGKRAGGASCGTKRIHARHDAYVSSCKQIEEESATTWDDTKARLDKEWGELKSLLDSK